MLFKWPSISQVLHYFPPLKRFCCTELQNIWMLICWGCFGTCRENWGFTTWAVKNNLLSGIHMDRNALDLNYHSYVVEATFNRKQMYVFSRLPLYSLKGRRKDVSSVAILWQQPRKWINRSKQQVKRICRPDTVWLFKWKEVNRILKEYIFIYSSVSFSFFHRHLKSTEWP